MILALVQARCGLEVTSRNGVLALHPLSLLLKAGLYGLGILAVFLSIRQAEGRHASEYYALMSLAVIGMGLLVGTQNLLMLFVALELMSLSLYALTGLRQETAAGGEAALKYFAFGSVSSALLLFGFSYLYGVTGGLHLEAMGTQLHNSPLLRVALVLVLVGFGFKVAAAPFHFWAPDVYQAAPAPVGALIGSGSKIASWWALVQILKMVTWLPWLSRPTSGLLAGLAVVTLVVGNLGALRQGNLKRLLAYSAVAQAGYLLTGLIALQQHSFIAVVFYSVVYGISALGVFGVVAVICEQNKLSENWHELTGVLRGQPGLAIILGIFLLSLAGLPPLAGFAGKYYLFLAGLLRGDEVGLVVVTLALAMSGVSFYYYVIILKRLALTESEQEVRLKVGKVEMMSLSLLAAMVVGMGLCPTPFFNFLSNYLK
jgi:NADH-quinone oxidoreductase subunit N